VPLTIKTGVVIKKLSAEMIRGLTIVEAVFAARGVECVITSGAEGEHMAGSLHPKGRALDLRSRDIKSPLATVKELKRQLGPSFDVILESDHIHMEYDPK
jgi:hypothetical protein